MNPSYRIRSLRSTDFPAITDLVARSFAADRSWGERRNLSEISIPALIAAAPRFNPALALVAEACDPSEMPASVPTGSAAAVQTPAESAGPVPDPLLDTIHSKRLLGLALWYPYRVQIRGRRVLAANLAPLAIDPDYWSRGIGSALMFSSRRVLEKAGISFAFLCGHEGYYPRFGFKCNMFGKAGLIPQRRPALSMSFRPDISGAGTRLRPPRPEDVPALLRLWENCLGESDFAIEPDPGFSPWLSFSPSVGSLVLERAGQLVAYARYTSANPIGPFSGNQAISATGLRLFLAADPNSAEILLDGLGIGSRTSITIPLHPESAAAKRLFPYGFKPVLQPGAYGLAMPLSGGPAEDSKAAIEYCSLREAGSISPGIPLFGNIFDL